MSGVVVVVALARWCFRRKWIVIFLWVAALAGAGVASGAAGSAYSYGFDVPGTESAKVMDLMEEAFPDRSGESDTVVWRVSDGSVSDPAVKQKMSGALSRISALPDVGSIDSPYAQGGEGQISKDGRIAYATVNLTKDQDGGLTTEQIKTLIDVAQAPAGGGLEVEVGGQTVAAAEEPSEQLSAVVALIAAAIVLFLAFGSLLGMLLPILSAVFAVGISVSVIILLSHVTYGNEVGPTVAVLVGLGVGIDYALFIATRHRRGLSRGLTPSEAAGQAFSTSGRAVMFAGGTVSVAMLGLLALNMDFLTSLAISLSLTVAVTVVAAITLLPALFGVFGMRMLSRRQRRGLAADGPQPEKGSTASARWATFLERHPRALTAVAVLVLAILAIPVFSIRLGLSDQGNLPKHTTARQAYDMLADGFGPGFNGQVQIVAELPAAGDSQAFDGLVARVRDTEGVARVQPLPVEPGAKFAVAQVIPDAAPQDAETSRLIDRLRDEVVPASEQGSGMRAYVGGSTALFKDFSSALADKLPLFFGTVITLGFILLLLAFRSLAIPLTSAIINLAAMAAAFGLLVAAFQWGWGGEVLGAGRKGPIETVIPVSVFPLMFGLSMDYQVFLISRMHEEWVATGDNRRAVRVGLTETSRVINAAAIIMICVFSAFLLSGERLVAQFGLGLAGAVALDAFLVRTALVPALMHQIGNANWWLPAWLDKRLPHLSVEGPRSASARAQEQPTSIGAP